MTSHLNSHEREGLRFIIDYFLERIKELEAEVEKAKQSPSYAIQLNENVMVNVWRVDKGNGDYRYYFSYSQAQAESATGAYPFHIEVMP